MKEELINLDTALLAKEKGFDLMCNSYYGNNPMNDLNNKLYNSEGGGFSDNSNSHRTSVPTQSLLQKWLREEHNLHIAVTQPWGYLIENINEGMDSPTAWNYNAGETYEEALEQGIKEALKLI